MGILNTFRKRRLRMLGISLLVTRALDGVRLEIVEETKKRSSKPRERGLRLPWTGYLWRKGGEGRPIGTRPKLTRVYARTGMAPGVGSGGGPRRYGGT